MPSPTFFLAGAPKAGTTSLFRYLGQHPEIAIASVKEPCYFAPELPVDAATDLHRQSWESYLALFAHAGQARAIGEGSVAYFSSATAAAAIHARLPGARILLMLRDPADRLFAHYSAARVARLTTAPFPEWIADTQRIEAARAPRWGSIHAGLYATHLDRFRACFPDAQIHVAFYEDFTSSPDAVLARIFHFLGVDATVTVDRSARHNVTTVSRAPALARPARAVLSQLLPARTIDRLRILSRTPARLSPSRDDRAHAIALYQHEITALSTMTGRDLSAWLAP